MEKGRLSAALKGGDMKNTLGDLNNYLFEAIERINDDDLVDPEMLDQEIKRAKATTEIARVVVENAKTTLAAMQYMDEAGYTASANRVAPSMLTAR